MGSQEVLGQAARLASSGLLLQVFSVWLVSAGASQHSWAGGPGAYPASRRTLLWSGSAGLVAVRWRLDRSWEPALRILTEQLQTSHFLSEHCVIHLVVGEDLIKC